jgi:GNAT superfamily N-acetyltransferase
MKVTARRAMIEDAEVLLELINAAYEHETKWKVGKRTSMSELQNIIPAQNVDPETHDYQILLVMVADDTEELSMLTESAASKRIVGHVRAEVKGQVAFFGMYAVWPALHGKGVGTKLLNALVQEISLVDASSQRTPTTTLEACVASENQYLFPIYAKMGFTLTSREVPVPSYFGPLQPGFENTTLKTITRDLSPFL